MNVEYRRKFLKELASLPSHSRKVIEQFAFVDLPKLDSLVHSGKIERMKGYPLHYVAAPRAAISTVSLSHQ